MTTIEIKPNVKINLDELFEGVSKLATPELEKFMDKIGNMVARRKVTRPSERELQLLSKIYEPLKAQTQRRYDLLNEKLRQETITEAERQEFLSLVDVAELHNVEWLESLIELAHLRGISVDELMKQLGLNKHAAA